MITLYNIIKRAFPIIVCISSIGCGEKDVTFDPAYQFSDLAGQRFVITGPLFLYRAQSLAEFNVYVPGELCPTIEENRNPETRKDRVAAGILTPGTVIQVERLMHNPMEVSGYPNEVVGKVLTGSFSGHTIALGLVTLNDGIPPYWHFDSRYFTVAASAP